ncbi:60S ribosomal protein L10A [Nosema bombycis CQ1]|nr:60S ribosomal protein L10A [Nosema bombycis]EOB13884.1 60S ribosomal protein L10A [Nosema bombycis CQ1]|eukprot:EOB13884.1 60S ribosomal protein L10A [Nosema bombycis CQ1]
MAKVMDSDELVFLDKTKIDSVLNDIKVENEDFTDTIQVQVNLKGLDPKRDNKITKDVTMPHKVRYMDKI